MEAITILQKIKQLMAMSYRRRANGLRAIKAPDVVVNKLESMADDIESGKWKFPGEVRGMHKSKLMSEFTRGWRRTDKNGYNEYLFVLPGSEYLYVYRDKYANIVTGVRYGLSTFKQEV